MLSCQIHDSLRLCIDWWMLCLSSELLNSKLRHHAVERRCLSSFSLCLSIYFPRKYFAEDKTLIGIQVSNTNRTALFCIKTECAFVSWSTWAISSRKYRKKLLLYGDERKSRVMSTDVRRYIDVLRCVSCRRFSFSNRRLRRTIVYAHHFSSDDKDAKCLLDIRKTVSSLVSTKENVAQFTHERSLRVTTDSLAVWNKRIDGEKPRLGK